MRVTPFRNQQARYVAGRQGMKIFMVSLGMLFAASLVGFFVIRYQRQEQWPDVPALPRALWISTVILLVSSVTMQWAVNQARAGHSGRMPMLITTLLGLAFLAVQAMCWLAWIGPENPLWSSARSARYALAAFYVLSGIHALHVIGGLVPLTVVTAHAFRGRYGTQHFPGLHYTAMYWHFLAVVWIILFTTLLAGL